MVSRLIALPDGKPKVTSRKPRLLSAAMPMRPPSAGPTTLAVVPLRVKLWVVARLDLPLLSVTALAAMSTVTVPLPLTWNFAAST